MADADNEANLLQVEMANKQPLLWRTELYPVTLVQGTATYTLSARLIAVQAAYITTTSGGVSTDRIIWPLSAFEYSSLTNKTTQAPPTAYWWNRQITPTATVWQVPDADDTYTLNFRVLSQIQDVSLAGGATLDMPYRALDVFVAGLAHRLSRIYAPDKEALRKADYLEAWNNFTLQDVDDNVSLFIAPDFSSYNRR